MEAGVIAGVTFTPANSYTNVVGRLATDYQPQPAFLVVFEKPVLRASIGRRRDYLPRAFGERRAGFFALAVVRALVERLVVVFLVVVLRTAISLAPGGREFQSYFLTRPVRKHSSSHGEQTQSLASIQSGVNS